MICTTHSALSGKGSASCSDWLSIGRLSAKFGVSQPTIRQMCENGLPHFRTEQGKHRRISENEFRRFVGLTAKDGPTKPRICIACRVSSPAQAKPRTDEPGAKSDLERQVEICRKYVKERWGNNCVVEECIRVASGLNFNSPQLVDFTLKLVQGSYDYVCITWKDRLARSAFNLFSNLAKQVGTEIVCIEQRDDPSFTESLVDDVVSLITIAASSHNGRKFGERVRINIDQEALIELYLLSKAGYTLNQIVAYAKEHNIVGTKGEVLQKQKIRVMFSRNHKVLELAAQERTPKENTFAIYLESHKVDQDRHELHAKYSRWCGDNGKVAITLTKMLQYLRSRGKATV
jgi:putative resolvase